MFTQHIPNIFTFSEEFHPHCKACSFDPNEGVLWYVEYRAGLSNAAGGRKDR